MNPYVYFKELILVTFKRYINNIETYFKNSNLYNENATLSVAFYFIP